MSIITLGLLTEHILVGRLILESIDATNLIHSFEVIIAEWISAVIFSIISLVDSENTIKRTVRIFCLE